MSLVKAIKDSDFESEVLKSSIPVLVEFWAKWCGPCKMMKPAVEDVAEEMGGVIKVVTMDIDDNQLTAPKFGVRGLPTIMLFKGGELIGKQIGATDQLDLFVEKNLK